MASSPPNRIAAVLAGLKRHPELDPQAVLSVARQEGLGGGIGDGGHAFGAFQLNDAGGVLTGKLPGASVGQKQSWAWSPQGIEYALAGISRVAGGQHGSRAVENIVRRFERPADPNKELAGALAAYGGQSSAAIPAGAAGGAAPVVSSSTAGAGAPDTRRQFAQNLLGAIGAGGQLDQGGLVQALMQRKQMSAVPEPAAAPTMAPSTARTADNPHGGLAELLHEGVGGPTHSTGEHIHAASADPQVMLALIAEAQRRGLSVRENPYAGDAVDPVHAKNSYHDRLFPGLFNGKKLGMAEDVSGPGMGAYEQWVRSRFGR